MTIQANKNFSYPVRVYYEDTDAGGVVYHANYLKFFERARTEMLRAIGFEHDQLKINEGIIFVVRFVQIDYLRSALFNELLTIDSVVTETKKASFTFEQQMMRHNEVLCHAVVRIACLDANTMRPKAIPISLLESLNA